MIYHQILDKSTIKKVMMCGYGLVKLTHQLSNNIFYYLDGLNDLIFSGNFE